MKRALIVASAVIAIGLGTAIGMAGQNRPPLYYRDPDGKPVFVDSAMAQAAAAPTRPPRQSGGDH